MLRFANLGASLLAFGVAVAYAQEPAPAPAQKDPAALAWEAANAVAVRGPASVPLQDQATLAVPENLAFIPLKEATTLMNLMGNQTGPTFVGLVFPMGDDAGWFASVSFEPSGYIHDDDAKDWKSDELLENLKAGTEEGNKFRAQQNVAPIEIMGWIEKPTYDPATHRLVWSIELRDKGTTPAREDITVNYNTYVLGRDGYVSLDLITNSARIEALKPTAQQLLGNIAFNDGKRYEQFNPDTDRVAEYGLAALIGGIAAKKLGMFAALGVMLAKFWKVGLIALAAFGAGIRKFFNRKENTAAPNTPA